MSHFVVFWIVAPCAVIVLFGATCGWNRRKKGGNLDADDSGEATHQRTAD